MMHAWPVRRKLAKYMYGEWGEFAASVGHPNAETFSASGGFPLIPRPGASSLDPAGGSVPDPRYRLALRAHHVCQSHICWPGDDPDPRTCLSRPDYLRLSRIDNSISSNFEQLFSMCLERIVVDAVQKIPQTLLTRWHRTVNLNQTQYDHHIGQHTS